MKYSFSKIFLAVMLIFFASDVSLAQTQCNSLKEIFENSDYCDGKWISLHGKIYTADNPDNQELRGSKYVYGFQFTDNGTSIIRVVSQDWLFLYKDDDVTINGSYHKKLYADGLNLENIIVASGKNIKVILTGEDYTDLLVNYVGKGIIKNESLQKRSIVLAALIPLFTAGAFYLGLIFYKRRQFKGRSFEGYVESLFRNNKEWRVGQDNSYRKLRKGWVESYGNPDFVFIHRRTNQKIAVECKYKEKEYERIFWADENQIERYQDFSAKEKMPVLVIIGVGGRPKNPKRMFFAPLDKIKYPDVKMDYLQKFERDPRKPLSLDSNGKLV